MRTHDLVRRIRTATGNGGRGDRYLVLVAPDFFRDADTQQEVEHAVGCIGFVADARIPADEMYLAKRIP